MPDYPHNARFLTPAERESTTRRLEDEASCQSPVQSSLGGVKQALQDWKLWLHILITIGMSVPLYCIAILLSTVVEDLGYRHEQAILMSIPPRLAACLVTVLGGVAADRQRQRGVYVVGFCLVA